MEVLLPSINPSLQSPGRPAKRHLLVDSGSSRVDKINIIDDQERGEERRAREATESASLHWHHDTEPSRASQRDFPETGEGKWRLVV